MKHRYNIMGVNRHGYAEGLSVIAEDMIDAIKISRNAMINPHSVCQAEQVSADSMIGLVTIYDAVATIMHPDV